MNSIISKFIILILVITSFNLNATNYYVSTTGNNSNGLSWTNSFRTIQQAVNVVGAGDTVFVANGTYAGFDIRENGNANSPIVFKATGNSVVINQKGPNREDGINVENANYVVIDGFKVNNMSSTGNGIRVVVSDFCAVRNCQCDHNARGIFTGFTDDIVIENNICSNSISEHGIYVSNSSDRPIIRYNECYGNTCCGIHMNGDASMGEDGIIHDAQVYGNKIYDNKKASAINMDGVVNSLIYNNLIYNNHDCQGIVLFQIDGGAVSSGAKIFNNTIIVPSDGRWGVLLQNAGANVGTQIYNNIIINLHSFRGCIGIRGTSEFGSNNNLTNGRFCTSGDDGPIIDLTAWKALGYDANSELAGSLTDIFVSPSSNDYHLKAGSQAIDKGNNLVNQIVHDDFEQHLRPAGSNYDLGAYEYGSVLLVEKNKLDDLIKISPNPTKDFFTISHLNQKTSLKKIELFDMNGKLIKFFELKNELDVSSVPSGLYFITIQTSDNQVIRKKVVIY